MTPLAGQILTLLIMLWGVSIMLRPVSGRQRRVSAPSYRGGGLVSRMVQGLIFSVLLPATWWTILLLGRFFQRAFIVFVEFLTGVPDWVTLRTSFFKFSGAALGFVAYNALLLLFLNLAVAFWGVPIPPKSSLAIVGGVAVLAGVPARLMMRRAP